MRKMVAMVAVPVMLLLACSVCLAADETVTVLDTYSVWRAHQTLKPPVIRFDDGVKPVMTSVAWLNTETAEPAAGWAKPEFDDTWWLRGSARNFAQTSYLSRLCLRARFEVTDPAQVDGLKLDLGYYGGVVVSVNGREVARAHVAQQGPVELAEGYPVDAFVTDEGEIMPSGWVAARYKRQMELRERSLKDVAIPADALRKGVNVLAIEIVRSPFHKIVDEKKGEQVDERRRLDKGTPYDLSWNTCELRDVRLTTPSGAAITVNSARPEGLQAWNSDFLAPDFTTDFGDRCEPLRPVTLRGVRGGWFSGKVVVGSPEDMGGLKAVCGDLKQGGATIPASQVRVRYGFPFGRTAIEGGAYPRAGSVLDGLLEKPLDVFPKGSTGAVVPIWVTVGVPADAKAGVYTGELTITANGAAAIRAPVRLEVADWTLPPLDERRAWVELIQSPDTLALEYDVPLWSDRHWAMIGEALRYVGEMGTRTIYVPLICNTNFGNAESMVRWIKKDDGTCDYDFSIMDRYLDLAARYIPNPQFVIFTAWEIYLNTPPKEIVIKEDDSSYVKMEKSWQAARWDLRGKGPAVTALDPDSREIATVHLPRFEEPEAKALWTPLFAALRKRMEKRGWQDAMALGMASDSWPSKEELAVLQEVSGGLSWVMHTHGGSRVGQSMRGIAPISYIAYVWNVEYSTDPAEGSLLGWKRPELVAEFMRFGALNNWPSSTILGFEELNITGRQRGVGRIGADFWPPIRNDKGERRGHAWDRYLQSLWHSLNLSSHMLVPGPDGPVASTRYEIFREGVQESEARIAIERVLSDDALRAKIGSELADRCQKFLTDRLLNVLRSGSSFQLTGRYYASADKGRRSYGGVAGHNWFLGSGWQDRAMELYALAGEVARKAGSK